LIYPFRDEAVEPTPAHPSRVIFRPKIPIWVGAFEGRRRPYLGLLDTGADDTAIPLSEAQRLGVTLDRSQPVLFRGVGGPTVGYYGEVTMELRQSPKSYVWAARVAFMADRDGSVLDGPKDVYLGQAGFFRHFHASFDFQRGRVKIRPNGLFVGLAR